MPPVAGSHDSSPVYVEAGAAVLLPLAATVAVLVRLWLRKKYKVNLWFDDALIVVPAIFSWFQWGIWMYITTNLIGSQAQVAQPRTADLLPKLCISMDELNGIGVSCVKFSLILFYWRSFGTTQTVRRWIIALFAFVAAYTVARVVETGIICIPICKQEPGNGYSVKAFFLIMRSLNWLTEFMILLFPIPILWRLHITTKQKIAITGVFFLGFVTIIASGLRLYFMARDYGRSDTGEIGTLVWFYEYYVPQMSHITILGLAELDIGILTATLPAIRSPAVQFARSARSKMVKTWSRSTVSNEITTPVSSIPSARVIQNWFADTKGTATSSFSEDEVSEKPGLTPRQSDIP